MYTFNAATIKTKMTAGNPVNMVANTITGVWKRMLKGTKRQLTNMNQPMMEMLRGRPGGFGAAIGGLGGGANPVGGAEPGGGGVAE
jgi:hypothetical protein